MLNICIHGHFYQPPRENPWTGEIELQPSASPYHDWNERIHSECYLPNSEARIIDSATGSTVAKLNNYEHINFNFGPTLLAWLKAKHISTYEKIIEADRKSIDQHNGHGNAIAMCYSHMIMPLANLNDKITQVKWGLADFRYHFRRESEGIWLPETAVNSETVEVLISENIKYIILDSSQAKSIRKLGDEQWQDITAIGLNTKLPYRCYSKINQDKFIDIFFYDGPVSKSVSFDDVLVSSQNLLNKIFNAAGENSDTDQLISVATDGETFGHHKKNAERTLAYFLNVLAPQNELKIVNFGQHLEQHSLEYEVELNTGPEDEGTSWSCVHGVKRWEDDCGCGGGGKWHQKWRRPLRDALNWLRDSLATVYEARGSLYFSDPWTARNNYIDVILNNSPESMGAFCALNCAGILTETEIQSASKLLEMQKYAMLMFTSCGWFFSEISGIETVKILEYAARAIEIAEEAAGIELEKEFVKRLSFAPSNVAEYQNGAGVWNKLVKASEPKG